MTLTVFKMAMMKTKNHEKKNGFIKAKKEPRIQAFDDRTREKRKGFRTSDGRRGVGCDRHTRTVRNSNVQSF
jgi:hypothetical protein